MIKTGFMLCAGFGTRFQPHTNFLPKPAMPFFNLPIALYPAGLLKLLDSKKIIYNSHHLQTALDQHLSHYLGSKSVYETEILDSAGGILNSKNELQYEENFWVINGDSFIATKDIELIRNHAKTHEDNEALATFFCIDKPSQVKSGLEADKNGNLTKISTSSKAQHFIGLYILNKRIFNFIKEKPSHIFKDIILPLIGTEKIKVVNLGRSTRWYETGSEENFIKSHIEETKYIFNETDQSFVSKIHKIWNPNYKSDLYTFLNNKVWGADQHAHPKSLFTCVPKNFKGDLKLLRNCVVTTNEQLPTKIFENKVLVDASQWN